MGRRVMGVGVTLLLAACAKETAAPRSSEALERSARILARLDQLEADLHDEGSKLAVYGELEQRHGQTSQIAWGVAVVSIACSVVHIAVSFQSRRVQVSSCLSGSR